LAAVSHQAERRETEQASPRAAYKIKDLREAIYSAPLREVF
jgi:hypothetical protein